MLEKQIQDELIEKGRAFTKGYRLDDPYEDIFESDQTLKRPQPPLVKAPVRPESEWIRLPLDFESLSMKNDLVRIIRDRRSSRIYTGEPMTLAQLSFLLWPPRASNPSGQGLCHHPYRSLRRRPTSV